MPGVSQLRISLLGYLLPSQILFIIFGAIALNAVLLGVKGFLPSSYLLQLKLFSTFLFFSLLIGLVIGFKAALVDRVIVQWLWIAMPYYYANAIIGIALKGSIDFKKLSFNILRAAAFVTLLVVLYNLIVYNSLYSKTRLQFPGLGSVVFGYTAVLLISLACVLKYLKVKKSWLILAVSIFLLAALLTQSRAAVYPALFMSCIFFFPEKHAGLKVLYCLGVALLIMMIDPIGQLSNYSSRILSFDSGRFATWRGIAECLKASDGFNALFGYGLGNVFPYQDWYTGLYSGYIDRGSTDGVWNSFIFMGQTLLVEPHNFYLWVMLETGIAGFLLIAGYFVLLIRETLSGLRRSSINLKLACLLMIAAVLVLNLFDAVLFVSSAATLWWVLLLIPLGLGGGCERTEEPRED